MATPDPLNRLIAIDPGNVESAIVCCDVSDGWPIPTQPRGLMLNADLRQLLRTTTIDCALLIEYTPPYTLQTKGGGAFTPREVVDTAIWIGRFIECWLPRRWELVSRNTVKTHLLGKNSGKESLVNAAVLERYGGTRRAAKGTKKQPGPLYGFNTHLYAALAVAVTWWEQRGVAV